MQHLAALLATSPSEAFDQLKHACDDSDQYRPKDRCRSDVLMTSSKCLSVSPPSSRQPAEDTPVSVTAGSISVNSSFSIDNILSPSPPQRRNHGDRDLADERQHQQSPDRFHHHHQQQQHHHYDQLSDGESCTSTYQNHRTSLHILGLRQSLLPSLPMSQPAFYGPYLKYSRFQT